MTVSLKHKFHSAKADGVDATVVQPSNWNDEHALACTAGNVLGNPAGSGATTVVEVPMGAGGAAILAANTTSDARAAIGAVNKAGDTMTGMLNLPANGLNVGSGQLQVTGGNVTANGDITAGGNLIATAQLQAPTVAAGSTLTVGGAPVPNTWVGQTTSLVIRVTSDTALSVTAATAAIPATVGRVTRANVSATATTSTTGAGGIDSGSVVASKWYHVWLIDNGTLTNLVMSQSPTAPTMPNGYTYSTRIGAVYVDANSKLMRTIQLGNRAQYQVTAATNTASLPMVVSGISGSVNTPTYTAASLSNFAPSTASRFLGVATAANSSTLVAPNNAYGSASSSTNPPPVNLAPYGNYAAMPFEFVLENTNVYYASSAAAGAVLAFGWVDTVNAV